MRLILDFLNGKQRISAQPEFGYLFFTKTGAFRVSEVAGKFVVVKLPYGIKKEMSVIPRTGNQIELE